MESRVQLALNEKIIGEKTIQEFKVYQSQSSLTLFKRQEDLVAMLPTIQ